MEELSIANADVESNEDYTGVSGDIRNVRILATLEMSWIAPQNVVQVL